MALTSGRHLSLPLIMLQLAFDTFRDNTPLTDEPEAARFPSQLTCTNKTCYAIIPIPVESSLFIRRTGEIKGRQEGGGKGQKKDGCLKA